MPILSPPTLPSYAELSCLSNFSFLHGASHPHELVERAYQLGYEALALTDECSVAGVVRAHVHAQKLGLKLLIGASFTVEDPHSNDNLKLVLLAENQQGYSHLCELISLARQRTTKGRYQLYYADLCSFTHDPPHAMIGCLAILLPAYNAPSEQLQRHLKWLNRHFSGRAWVGLQLLLQAQDEQHKQLLITAASQHQLPIVATGQVRMHVRSRKPLLDTLTAIRQHTTLAESASYRFSNAEQHLRSRLRLANLYAPEHLHESVLIARRCQFSLTQIQYQYPHEICPPQQSPFQYLREQTYIGARWRYPQGIPKHVHELLEKELNIIHDLNYEAYFLTVYDIVQFARQQHILCQGRGSAANSAVCFCLGITEVDPDQSSTLFERFISKERNEPPDIDVDFEHQRREEVIQYIYQKYGQKRAALTAVVISYRAKSALRDVGKALGIDPLIVDRIAKAHSQWDGRDSLAPRMQEYGIDLNAKQSKLWLQLSENLIGFPRHLSQHPGGFVISRGPLTQLVPIENAAMPQRRIVQWDKDDLDALNFLKVDVLALGMLTVIRRALAYVSERRGVPFMQHDIPNDDPATYQMIQRADTIGTFQIESRAQIAMLPRLKPKTFYDLVVQVAIVRPGPTQGNMVHPYLMRREKNEKVTYPKDELKVALERTLGVPIFQEQVMQIAMIAAGFSAEDANGLRRAMATWKRRGGMNEYYEKIVHGMTSNGYEESFAQQIFRQIEGFGEYGFPESHAASFALLAYHSSWLKCHEPEAYLTALLNSQPMGIYSPSTLINYAKRHQVRVHPIDVMYSNWDSRLEFMTSPQQRPAVRLGLNLVKGLSQDCGWRVEEARAIKAFNSVRDLAERALLSKHELQHLAYADALHSLSGHRYNASWEASASLPDTDLLKNAVIIENNNDQPTLNEPSLLHTVLADHLHTGVSLQAHPMALLREHLQRKGYLHSQQLIAQPDRRLTRACGIVTIRQRPGTAKGVVFVTLEDEFGQINLVLHAHVAERYRQILRHAVILGAFGVWQAHKESRSLLVKRIVDLSQLLPSFTNKSRDFH